MQTFVSKRRFHSCQKQTFDRSRVSRLVCRYNAWLRQPSGLAMYSATVGSRRYSFRDLANLLAKASPLRSGDQLAGLSADTDEERIAAQHVLADLPLATFLHEQVVPYEACEVTRLIVDKHDQKAFAPVAHLTVGEFRDLLLSDERTTSALAALTPGCSRTRGQHARGPLWRQGSCRRWRPRSAKSAACRI